MLIQGFESLRSPIKAGTSWTRGTSVGRRSFSERPGPTVAIPRSLPSSKCKWGSQQLGRPGAQQKQGVVMGCPRQAWSNERRHWEEIYYGPKSADDRDLRRRNAGSCLIGRSG